MLHCNPLLKKLARDNFAIYLRQCMLFVALFSLTACKCVKNLGNKNKIDPDKKNATLTLLTNKQQLRILDPTFILTLQHQGTSPISLDSYTLELTLQEEGGQGTKLKYTDVGSQSKEPTSIQENLTHFTTFKKLDSTLAKFDIPFELVPGLGVNKVVITIKLYPKDQPTSSQQETVTWKGATPITAKMIETAKQAGNNDLATTLQDLKDGKNVGDDTKDKALREAATMMNKDMFQALLDRGANPNPKIASEQSKLYSHAAKGQEEYVRFLLQFPEVDVNVKYSGNQDNTPLHSASAYPGSKALKPLIDNPRTDVNAINALGETALHIAAQKGLIDSVKLLLSREDVDTQIKNKASQTPLDVTTDPTIKSLLQNHKQVPKDSTKVDSVKLQEELRQAYEADDANALQTLLNQGADPNIFSMPRVIEDKKINSLEFLLKATGININAKESSGNTALHAIFYTTGYSLEERLKAVDLLLKTPNIDVNAQNDAKETPLHTAVRGSSTTKEMIELLLANPNININIKDRWGATPLEIATDSTIRTLLQNHK